MRRKESNTQTTISRRAMIMCIYWVVELKLLGKKFKMDWKEKKFLPLRRKKKWENSRRKERNDCGEFLQYSICIKFIIYILNSNLKMIGLVRKIVAGPKKKTTWNGVELDLTYITDRLIAMAFPASGLEKAYRNSINDVA